MIAVDGAAQLTVHLSDNKWLFAQDVLANERLERQRLEVDLKAAQTSRAAELQETRDSLAAAETAARLAEERAQQAVAEGERTAGQLAEARDAFKVFCS